METYPTEFVGDCPAFGTAPRQNDCAYVAWMRANKQGRLKIHELAYRAFLNVGVLKRKSAD